MRGSFNNTFWKFLERCASQGVSFILQIVLARILLPEEFGKISMIMVFVNIFQIIADGGMGNALIQKKGVSERDFSTVFYFNIFLCVFLYLIVFFFSPYIALFLESEDYTIIIRIAGTSILIYGIKNVLMSFVSVKMMFKSLFFASAISALASGLIGIALAYGGFGIWSIVFQNVINAYLATFLLWGLLKWLPKEKFYFENLKKLFSFGSKVFLVNITNAIYDDITILLIGKKYSSDDLAYYEQGRKFPRIIISNINTSIDTVLFPTLASKQDSALKMKESASKTLKLSCYVIFPIMIGLSACAPIFVDVVLTSKWSFCIPYIYIFCFYYALYPFNTVNINITKSLGKSTEYLFLEIIKKVFELTIILITIQYGVLYLAIGLCVSGVINCFINCIPSYKYLSYGIFKQFVDVAKIAFATFLMGVLVLVTGFFPLFGIAKLFVQVLVGILAYILLSSIFRIDSFYFFKHKFLSVFKKRRKT